jgi:hypothetical protein
MMTSKLTLALTCPPQLAVWFAMIACDPLELPAADLAAYLRLTSARGSIPGMPELADLPPAWHPVIRGWPVQQQLPVLCYHCGESYGTAYGGKLLTHCPACSPLHPGDNGIWLTLHSMTGYPEDVLQAMYLLNYTQNARI